MKTRNMRNSLKKLFKAFSYTNKKVQFLLENVITLSLNHKSNVVDKKIGQGKYGKVFTLKNNKKRVVKLLGKGFNKTTYKNLEKLALNNFQGTESEVNCASALLDAFIESFNLMKAEKSKITPKFFDLYLVRYNGKLYPAIEMEKIEGNSLIKIIKYSKKDIFLDKDGTIRLGKKNDTLQYKPVIKKFKKLNIKHKDIHLGNILVNNKGEYKIIDFSAPFIAHKFQSKFKRFFVYSRKLYQLNYTNYHQLKIYFN